jgi:hypothetical protein
MEEAIVPVLAVVVEMAGVIGLVGRGFAQVESAVSRVADVRRSGEEHHSSPVTDTGPHKKQWTGFGQHVNFVTRSLLFQTSCQFATAATWYVHVQSPYPT